jgi:hypothetical protein
MVPLKGLIIGDERWYGGIERWLGHRPICPLQPVIVADDGVLWRVCDWVHVDVVQTGGLEGERQYLE